MARNQQAAGLLALCLFAAPCFPNTFPGNKNPGAPSRPAHLAGRYGRYPAPTGAVPLKPEGPGEYPLQPAPAPSFLAQNPEVPQPAIEPQISLAASPLPHRTPQEYATRIANLRDLTTACRAGTPACDPGKVGEDIAVDRPGSPFEARFGWLRDALKDAQKAKQEDRAGAMRAASDRLADDLAQASSPPAAPPAAPPDPATARTRADAILAQPEFRMVDPNSELARRWALFGMMVDRFLTSFFSGMPKAPWAVPLIEWGILALAAIGLVLWAWRTTRQQRLAVALPASSFHAQWQKESDDWARRAEQQAAAANWREAVHCLYWSAIVLLEGKRLWRANRARTPREYLPLLEAGTPRRNALTGLTRIFERIWYGLRDADRADFEQAQALLEELKAA